MTEFKICQHSDTYENQLLDMDSEKPVHLWCVTYTYKDGHVTGYTTTVHVLASDEAGAISQGSDNALGPFRPSAVESTIAMEDGRLTATATRVPFLIRGWGRQTF